MTTILTPDEAAPLLKRSPTAAAQITAAGRMEVRSTRSRANRRRTR